MPAKYIMKCDDDTFVKVDSIMNEIKRVSGTGSVYIGNINYYHKPLRYGKWAVTYEVSSHISRLCISSNMNAPPLHTLLYLASFSNVGCVDCFIQEWPEEDYPPYANGPGYIVSSDIAQFVTSDFERRKLRVRYTFTLNIS